MNHCLITGCELFVKAEGKMLHGDLHWIGETWVFQGISDGKGTLWYWPDNPGAELPANWRSSNVLIVTGEYLERGSVIVIPMMAAHLNDAGLAYVRKWGWPR